MLLSFINDIAPVYNEDKFSFTKLSDILFSLSLVCEYLCIPTKFSESVFHSERLKNLEVV